MGFANAESIPFYALLARWNLGLDSGICSFWDSIQNPRNWLLTSGSQVRVLHGSSHKINNLRAVSDGRSTCFCYNFATIRSAHLPPHLFETRVVVDHRGARTGMSHQVGDI